MADAPERIYLQDAGDYSKASLLEVTWCVEPQDDADTEYIRADLARPPTLAEALALPEVQALVEASAELKKDMLLRAEMRADVIRGTQYRVVNAGNGVWKLFCDALARIGEGGE